MDNNKYFYISGFISLSLFFSFFALMVFTILTTSKLNVYGMKKDNYISVSIKLPKQKLKIRKIRKIRKKSSYKKPKNNIVKQKNVNIDELFSDVWTKKIKKIKKQKKLNNKRLLKIQRKSKMINKNKIIADKTKNNLETLTDAESTSTSNEVNEYRAKIQALVYNSFNPPPNSVGDIVIAYIEISAIGKMSDFRILKYSSNEDLNKECDKIKARLLGVLFPINPSNKIFKTKINLIPEDK